MNSNLTMPLFSVPSRRIHVGGWWHCGGDLPHLHRDRLQAPQRRPQEADAAGLRGRQCVEEEPAGRGLSFSLSLAVLPKKQQKLLLAL